MTDRRRRQKEQRAAKIEAEKKQEARKELGRRLGTALVFGVIVVGIFVVGAYFGEDEGQLPGGYEGFRDQPTACGADQPDPEEVLTFSAPEPQTDVTPESTVTVSLETSCGPIVMALDPAASPATVNSFVFLTREGFFDGQVFYRIVEDFRVFSGDPEANGTGGPGYRIPDEFPPEDFEIAPTWCSWTMSGVAHRGSQFFILTGEAPPRHSTPSSTCWVRWYRARRPWRRSQTSRRRSGPARRSRAFRWRRSTSRAPQLK